MKNNVFLSVIVLVGILLSAERSIFSQPSISALKTGTKVPEFMLLDQNGKSFDIKNILGKKNLVIYFYLKDDTPGCTKESCSFRDQFEVFVKAQAMIIGISAQSVESHKQFADKYKLPFTLLSDSYNRVRKMFGVNEGGGGTVPGRVTFVIDKTGKIVYVFDSVAQPVQHVNEALNVLNNLN